MIVFWKSSPSRYDISRRIAFSLRRSTTLLLMLIASPIGDCMHSSFVSLSNAFTLNHTVNKHWW